MKTLQGIFLGIVLCLAISTTTKSTWVGFYKKSVSSVVNFMNH